MILEDITVIASDLKFPEGPIAMPDGGFLVVEIMGGTLTYVSPDKVVSTVAKCGGSPNGAAIGPDGRVYICNSGGFNFTPSIPQGETLPASITEPDDFQGGSIQAVDLNTGEVDTLYTHCNGHRLIGPNDIVFDKQGNFWFSDLGKTRARDLDYGNVYYASPDGKMIKHAANQIHGANGIGLSPDESTLYYAETNTGHLYHRKITDEGELEPTKGFFDRGFLMGHSNGSHFDSLAVDAAGNICVATLGHNNGITVVSPDGKSVEILRLPPEYQDPFTTNICFGGDDMQTAYITLSSLGLLVSCKWPKPGLKLNFLNT